MKLKKILKFIVIFELVLLGMIFVKTLTISFYKVSTIIASVFLAILIMAVLEFIREKRKKK